MEAALLVHWRDPDKCGDLFLAGGAEFGEFGDERGSRDGAGGSDRPPLWAAFVALAWLAMPVAFVLGPLLLALVAG